MKNTVFYNLHIDDFIAKPVSFLLARRRALKKYGFLVKQLPSNEEKLNVYVDFNYSSLIRASKFQILPFVIRKLIVQLEVWCWIYINDLQKRIGNIVIGYTKSNEPVRAKELNADGAITALLKDAFQPNLVQTLENNPAFMHGGPFANIAHGCNSVVSTKTALKLADYIYIMNSGNIVAHGNRSEILKKGDLMSSLTGVEN